MFERSFGRSVDRAVARAPPRLYFTKEVVVGITTSGNTFFSVLIAKRLLAFPDRGQSERTSLEVYSIGAVVELLGENKGDPCSSLRGSAMKRERFGLGMEARAANQAIAAVEDGVFRFLLLYCHAYCRSSGGANTTTTTINSTAVLPLLLYCFC